MLLYLTLGASLEENKLRTRHALSNNVCIQYDRAHKVAGTNMKLPTASTNSSSIIMISINLIYDAVTSMNLRCEAVHFTSSVFSINNYISMGTRND
jgi:hypothetical protein